MGIDELRTAFADGTLRKSKQIDTSLVRIASYFDKKTTPSPAVAGRYTVSLSSRSEGGAKRARLEDCGHTCQRE